MRSFVYVLTLLLFSFAARAQTYYQVTHLAGPQMVGVNTITVVPVNNPASATNCNVGPYVVGNGNIQNAYLFKFTLPVTLLRLEFANIGDDEFFGIEINGAFYPITASNISPITCVPPNPLPMAEASNGYITNLLTGSNKHGRVDIDPGYFIDSVKVFFHSGSKFGANCSFYFATDPHVYTAPFTDTTLCTGDSIQVRYLISDIFNTSNDFSIQLSDANGNFTNGTIIGTLHDYLPGKVLCGIPANLPPGKDYRYRVISTIPADTSAVNPEHIRISDYPVIVATVNSPVCEGEMINLEAELDTAGVIIDWIGPAGFSSKLLATSFIAEQKHTGPYKITADKFSCKSTATVSVKVKPIPAITAAGNNGPICEGETLRLTAEASDTAVRYNWTGPGFSSMLKSPEIFNASYGANGTYTVTATLEGCTSPADSTTAVIHQRPLKPQITANNPVTPADNLTFSAVTTPGATYEWAGPHNFYSTEPTPVIKQADINAEGKYTLTVTLGGCSATSTIDIDVLESRLYYYLSPNPSNGTFTLEGNYRVDNRIPVTIVNSMGQVVYESEVYTMDKFLHLNIDLKNKLSDGVYLLKVKLKDKMITTRFTVAQ